MKLSTLAVMEIDNVEFKILSSKILFNFKGKDIFLNEQFLKIFLKPLFLEKFTEQYVKDIEYGIKKQGYEFCKTSNPATFLMFKNIEKYRVYLQKKEDHVFGLLLYKLNPEEMDDIKSKAIMESSAEDEDFQKNDIH